MRKIVESRDKGDRLKVRLLPLSLSLAAGQITGKQSDQMARFGRIL
ncbi:Hypothetical protein NGAL_HAMBI1145_59020 [Neorhizobium galegae bv. officinalis]|uniref:Uncharacterized protein n=1 Tax=Neorhizobium galegae bv. officinalis TaxID=323656 RepID=A0A0T7G2A6_NEOGA|nr:Hypothetical protein NGAL_HAMBI1145_59020 [Neorhizobium galegae bv. officinalis]CDZ46140.1 Hypothetical protein NGAL_HAMBI1189_12560 [Neorhizobium galegae bv. officinalis]